MPLPDTIVDLVQALGLVPHPEGGFFLETFRSGTTPMTSRGQTEFNVDTKDLVTTIGRSECRPDQDQRRNCLTSIFWVPTIKSPVLALGVNHSDHVHYYQGGQAFQYILYDPERNILSKPILGPDVQKGHCLQLPVNGGIWKCGHLVSLEQESKADYTLIGEAVAPGFDYHDFQFVQAKQLQALPDDIAKLLQGYLLKGDEDFDNHYNNDEIKQQREKERI